MLVQTWGAPIVLLLIIAGCGDTTETFDADAPDGKTMLDVLADDADGADAAAPVGDAGLQGAVVIREYPAADFAGGPRCDDGSAREHKCEPRGTCVRPLEGEVDGLCREYDIFYTPYFEGGGAACNDGYARLECQPGGSCMTRATATVPGQCRDIPGEYQPYFEASGDYCSDGIANYHCEAGDECAEPKTREGFGRCLRR